MADKKDKRDDVDNEWQDGEEETEGEAKGGSEDEGWEEDDDWEDADDDGEDDDDDDEDGSDEKATDDDEPVDDEVGSDDESDDDDDESDDDDDDDDEDQSDDDESDDVESDDEDDEDDDDEDWLPDWAPWAVLLGLVTLGLLGGFGFFSSKTEDEASAADVPSTADSAVEPETQRPAPAPEPTAKQREAEEEIRASHLLVAYAGAQRARPDITRTKEEAKKRAEEALKKAKAPGADFAKIVAEYSDEPGAAQRGGDLRKFSRRRMVKEFSDAAFKLKVGEVSDVVETGFGFHVIKRTE